MSQNCYREKSQQL